MEKLNVGQQPRGTKVFLGIALLLALFSLAACGRPLFGKDDRETASSKPTADAPNLSANSQNASISLQPASGYGGLYIQVQGSNWPQNMLVLVTLEDAQGRSETLAASDTDQAGTLTTGFLFPIDQRWLNSDSPWIVATTADGQLESKAQFTLVPPGTEVAAAPPATTDAITTTSDVTTTKGAKSNSTPVTDTVAGINKDLDHTLVLPLVASAGLERGSSRTARNSSARNSSSSGVTQVEIDVDTGGSIDCNNGNGWITVGILSGSGFDATSVDPESVSVFNSSELGYRQDSAAITFVAFKESPAAKQRAAYQWRWSLDDMDGDGSMDMVMEFQISYTDLTCDGAVVTVSGRTRDGKSFEGSNKVDMLVLERG